jgi:hypothetical protein
MLGQIISHYRNLEKLGEGGMGVVNKAQGIKQSESVYRTLTSDPRLILDQKSPIFAVHAIDNAFLISWRSWSSREEKILAFQVRLE